MNRIWVWIIFTRRYVYPQNVCVCVLEMRSSVVRALQPNNTYFRQRTSFRKTCCKIRFLSHNISCILLIMLYIFFVKIISKFWKKGIPSNLNVQPHREGVIFVESRTTVYFIRSMCCLLTWVPVLGLIPDFWWSRYGRPVGFLLQIVAIVQHVNKICSCLQCVS
jgi:hypothetical protein